MHGKCPPERQKRLWEIKRRDDCAIICTSLRYIEKLLRSNVLANHMEPADHRGVIDLAETVAAIASKYEAAP